MNGSFLISSSLIFYVTASPKVIIEIEPSRVSEGQNVTITCSVEDGTPTPTVRLRTANGDPANPIQEKQGNFDVVLAEVTVDQAGVYICEASNSVGNASDERELIVGMPIKFCIDICAFGGSRIYLSIHYTFYIMISLISLSNSNNIQGGPPKRTAHIWPNLLIPW